MLKLIRTHWSKIQTGLLFATLLGLGGNEMYRRYVSDDCCQPGAPCCHPGAPCCHGALARK